MEALNAFVEYLALPHAQQAVLAPGLAVLAASGVASAPSVRTCRTVALGLFAFGLLFSPLTARWVVTSEARELYILPWAFFGVALCVWANIQVSAPCAFGATFVSLLTTDVALSLDYARQMGEPLATAYHGVGGGGPTDGLVVFPLLSALLVHYGRWRRVGAVIRAGCVPSRPA